MKLKNFLFLATAFALGFTACSDSEDEKPAVGITAATIAPAGSSVEYKLAPTATGQLDNNADSVAWDVTDAALQEAVLKVTPTLNTTVTYNGTEVTAAGITIDATQPIVLQATGSGITNTVTVKVYRAKTAAEGLAKKATLDATNVVWRDFAYFKGKFYAFIVTKTITDASTGAAKEDYLLKKSTDGVTWTDVDYAVTNVEKEVIGGEGARLAVFNDKLYVLLGQRVLGEDKYGNPAEIENGWFGPSPTILKWRAFVSEDGEKFISLEEESQLKVKDETRAIYTSYNAPFANAFVFKNALYLQGGYVYGFGMQQTNRNFLKTMDGKLWENLSLTDAEGASIALPNDCAFFELGGKLFVVGGYRNFISANNINKSVYSTEDGTKWTTVAAEVAGAPALYQAKAVSDGKVAYLFGGESLNDSEERVINNKVYRSTDGVNWTEVTASSAYAGSRFASAVLLGNVVWFFDGDATVSTGNYPAPASTDAYPGNVWNMPMK